MPRRIAQDGDDALSSAYASAMRPFRVRLARCVLQRCTEPSARHNARTARAARMAFVRPTGLARASQASMATSVTSAWLAYMGSAVTLPVHALSMVGVLGMGPANVQMGGWETHVTSALQATLGPSARRFAMPGSIAVRRACVSATRAAGAWIRTAEQTAAGVEMVYSVQIASMNAGQTRVPIVAAV